MERDYAEDVNYWKTGRSSCEEIIDKTKREIRKVGGVILGSMTIEQDDTGVAAIAIAFELHSDRFQIKWPVLLSKNGEVQAAKRQAATALYYDVKSTCVKAKFFGARVAFLAHLQLPNGTTAAEAANRELMSQLPKLLQGVSAVEEK